MTGAMFCIAGCVSCGQMISFAPSRVPSIRVEGRREPLCRGCFDRWNEIHRVSKGLPPVPLQPGAYAPEECV